ncbi:ROK family protein [Lacrimispora brassicae]
MAEMVGKPSVIKLLNKDVVEGIIRGNGPITKPEIAKQSQLSLVTVNKTVATLIQEGKVRVSGASESTGGRRAASFEINHESNFYIGLYYYKNHYIGAISDSIGGLIYEQEFRARVDIYEEIMEDTYAALDSLIEKCGDHKIKAIGIGVPGVVKECTITNIPNIPSWEGKDISGILSDKYQLPVLLENDIKLTTLGIYTTEYQNNKVRNMALIYLDQGIGSGFIINRSLFKGFSNFAGELGYIPVKQHFPIKESRYKGNFETQISLISEAIEQSLGLPEQEMYKDMLIRTITEGLLSVICVLNPEIIVMKHSCLTEHDCRKIQRELSDWLDESNVPFIVNAADLSKSSIQGVIRMCIRESTSAYSLSNKKRG